MTLPERLALSVDLRAAGLTPDVEAEAAAAANVAARKGICEACEHLRGMDAIGPYCRIGNACCGGLSPANVDLAVGVCNAGHW